MRLSASLTPPAIKDPLLVVIIGVAGLVVNLIGLALFSSNATLKNTHSHSHSHSHSGGAHHSGADAHQDENCVADDNEEAAAAVTESQAHKSANLHAVFIHVLGDALGSIGAIATGLIVMYVPYDWKHYADPLLSALLALIILKASVPIVVQSGKLLLQSVPKSIDLEKLSQQLLNIDGVDYVGSIHVWALSAEQYVASVHLDCLTSVPFGSVSGQVKELFKTFGVGNVTVEPHFVERALTVDAETKLHLATAHRSQFRCE
jgi:zinc transporter 1